MLFSPSHTPGEKKFIIYTTAAVLFVIAFFPAFMWLIKPERSFLLPYPFNTDDHMVYAAWMRQAAEGRILFENRFTLDPQPGLTFSAFFLVLGWISVLVGTSMTALAVQLALSAVVILFLSRLVARIFSNTLERNLSLIFALFGAGFGFINFSNFGNVVEPARQNWFNRLALYRLPTDQWQPEGFVFPSLLTNALFAWALALMLLIFLSVLRLKIGWKGAAVGALAFALLANTHTYDVVTVALVLVGLVAAEFAVRNLTKEWLLRAGVIALGVIPAAVWLIYVLRVDPVFAARAETPTWSPNFRGFVFGYLPLMVLAAVEIVASSDRAARIRVGAGVAVYVVLVSVLWQLSLSHVLFVSFLNWSGFATALLVTYVAVALSATGNSTRNLLVAWAFVGTIAVYLPEAFQRKLAMGLSIPWAILAAGGAIRLANPLRQARLPALAGLTAVCVATSAFWIKRQLNYVASNVTSTTVQSIFWPGDVRKIIDKLSSESRNATFIAPPGVPNALEGGGFGVPAVPDLNPVLVGMAGARAYAGHWSETPDYNRRRAQVSQLYFGREATAELVAEFCRENGIRYVVVPERYRNQMAYTLDSVADKVVAGEDYSLYRIR